MTVSLQPKSYRSVSLSRPMQKKQNYGKKPIVTIKKTI